MSQDARITRQFQSRPQKDKRYLKFGEGLLLFLYNILKQRGFRCSDFPWNLPSIYHHICHHLPPATGSLSIGIFSDAMSQLPRRSKGGDRTFLVVDLGTQNGEDPIQNHYCLVVWNIFCFSIHIRNNHPNWRAHIFQRGGSTTNQIMVC